MTSWVDDDTDMAAAADDDVTVDGTVDQDGGDPDYDGNVVMLWTLS